MKKIKADLHIHSVLSPCGSLDMSPRAIVLQAKQIGLDLIAIADHNSLANSLRIGAFARRQGLEFLYAAELQSLEEVHLLAYFSAGHQAERFSQDLEPWMTTQPNNPVSAPPGQSSGEVVWMADRMMKPGLYQIRISLFRPGCLEQVVEETAKTLQGLTNG